METDFTHILLPTFTNRTNKDYNDEIGLGQLSATLEDLAKDCYYKLDRSKKE